MKRREFFTRVGGAGVATAGISGVTAAQSTSSSGSDPRKGSGTKSDPYVVDMIGTSDVYFDPVGLLVEKGDYVKWVIQSGGHSTTSYTKGNPREQAGDLVPNGAKGWDSGVLKQKGASFTHQFTVEGTYDYYCIPHKTLGMVGRIVCGKPGGPAESTTIPDDVGRGVMPGSDTIVKEKALSYPYFPPTPGKPLSGLAIGGVGLFVLANAYLLSQSDRFSGRYDEDVPDDRDV